MVRVGTASWTDKSLIDSGRFYPPSVKTPEDRLRFYASQFALAEVDSSYYAMPAPSVSQLWTERTPASFVFNVKAFFAFSLGIKRRWRLSPRTFGTRSVP
jgi:uncharacterized protein YecE (DUF72 family)